MIVEEKVIVEIKAGATLVNGAKAQLITYVRLSGLELGLLLYWDQAPSLRA